MNRDINEFNYACEMVLLYNIKCRFTVLIYGGCITGELEAKVLKDRSEPLDRFGG